MCLHELDMLLECKLLCLHVVQRCVGVETSVTNRPAWTHCSNNGPQHSIPCVGFVGSVGENRSENSDSAVIVACYLLRPLMPPHVVPHKTLAVLRIPPPPTTHNTTP